MGLFKNLVAMNDGSRVMENNSGFAKMFFKEQL